MPSEISSHTRDESVKPRGPNSIENDNVAIINDIIDDNGAIINDIDDPCIKESQTLNQYMTH